MESLEEREKERVTHENQDVGNVQEGIIERHETEKEERRMPEITRLSHPNLTGNPQTGRSSSCYLVSLMSTFSNRNEPVS